MKQMRTKGLSNPQLDFLTVVMEHGSYRTPFMGNRHAGCTASAWYRTAESLRSKGLIVLTRSGDAQVATLHPDYLDNECPTCMGDTDTEGKDPCDCQGGLDR